MRPEALHVGLGAAADLPPATVTSYEARLKHLAMVSESLRPIGNMLATMGPLAPPCLAIPYDDMRDRVQSAAAKLLASMRDHGTADEWKRFESAMGGGVLFPDPRGRPTGPIDSIASMPRLVEFWRDAPPQWWGTITQTPGPMGKLGATPLLPGGSPLLLPSSTSSIPRVIFTRAGATEAVSWAARIWRSPVVRAIRAGGRFFERGLIVLAVADFAWEAGRRIYTWIWGSDPPPDVSAEVDAAIAFFNNEFWPEVVQQLEGVMLAMASAGTNPAALLQALLAIDPRKLPMPPEMGPDGSEFDWKGLVPNAARHGDPWAALGVLVFGTAADLTLARYG